MRDLKVEVKEIRERCGARHRVGDVFFIRGGGTIEIPEGKRVCLFALNSLFPFLSAKQRESSESDWVSGTEILCCPDPKGVAFRVSAI